MKQNKIIIPGKITADGRLSMYMQELKEFAKSWKNAKVLATFRVYQPGTSEALRGYYYNYVVPTIRRALWETGLRMTNEQAEKWMRERSPIMYEQEPLLEIGKYTSRIREISELDNSELVEHIETIKQLAAEELSTYVADPGE